jgi:hypothetical protein
MSNCTWVAGLVATIAIGLNAAQASMVVGFNSGCDGTCFITSSSPWHESDMTVTPTFTWFRVYFVPQAPDPDQEMTLTNSVDSFGRTERGAHFSYDIGNFDLESVDI